MNMTIVLVFALGIPLLLGGDSVEIQRHEVEDRLHLTLFRDYNEFIVPYPNSSGPVRIEFNPPIVSISALDALTQTLTAELFLKMVWNDTRLVWNPDDYLGIKVLLVSQHLVWIPDVKLLNSAKYAEYSAKSSSPVFVHYNGQVVWTSPSTKSTHCEINLKYFPYDVHNCFFKFGSWTYDGFHIDVDLHPSVTVQNPFNDGFNVAGEWEILASEAKKTMNKYECCDSPWPDVSFYVTLGRRSPFYKVAIFCPLFAVVILLLTSFWISPLKTERLTANLVVLAMLFFLIFYLSGKLPAVGRSVPVIMSLCAVLVLLAAFATSATLLLCNLAMTKPSSVILRWTSTKAFKMFSEALCISVPASFEPLAKEDNQFILMDNDISKTSQLTTFHQEELWTPLFQIIDRLTFILCAVIITSLTTYISS